MCTFFLMFFALILGIKANNYLPDMNGNTGSYEIFPKETMVFLHPPVKLLEGNQVKDGSDNLSPTSDGKHAGRAPK